MFSPMLQVIQLSLPCLDYMRAVIENGNKFTKVHLFMMLKELNYEHIDS